MDAKTLENLMNIRRPAAAFGRPGGTPLCIQRALVWLARPPWPNWRIGTDRNRRALAQLDDGQLSNLSEIGRQVRRDARWRP